MSFIKLRNSLNGHPDVYCSVFQNVLCLSVIMEGRVKKLFTPVTSSASVRPGLQALSVKSVSHQQKLIFITV